MKLKNNKKIIMEGSRAIALTINNIEPQVISAYPITPQTHIVEDLAKIKADGKAKYEYIRSESEFTAASIVLGASAKGARVYSATSSQGLLLMNEVLYNISGMRLPIVMTLANRAISAPINIWNDHSDAMTIRDAGWLMFFAENNQEAVEQHLLAYKIAEKMALPAMVNVDGFILTHCYEPIFIPNKKEVQKFLPKYRPQTGTFLDSKKPITMGAFMTPLHYQATRQKLFEDFQSSISEIKKEYVNLNKILYPEKKLNNKNDNGLLEYVGPQKPDMIVVAMGSVVGTIKSAINNLKGAKGKFGKSIGILKIRTYRPFPAEEIYAIIKGVKNILVLEKAISPGNYSPLYIDMKSIGLDKQNIKSFISGLGGKDIKEETIIEVIKKFNSYKKINFI